MVYEGLQARVILGDLPSSSSRAPFRDYLAMAARVYSVQERKLEPNRGGRKPWLTDEQKAESARRRREKHAETMRQWRRRNCGKVGA